MGLLDTLARGILREDLKEISNQLVASDSNIAMLKERLVELELAAEDKGWLRLSGAYEREFDREQLRDMMALSRLMYLKNPLINRGVNLQAVYVWGQGMNVKARHERVDEVLQGFRDDYRNRAELTSHQARTLKEVDLQVYGNIFFCLIPDNSNGMVHIRSIPPDEIVDIMCNPEDSKEVWYYKRQWVQKQVPSESEMVPSTAKTAFYPDWLYTPTSKPEKLANHEIEWGMPVYHVKVGGLSDMRFGVPEVYQALDWALAYKNFLEDWATIVRALARFAWNLRTAAGPTGVAAAKARLETALASGGGASAETNPAPVVGSTFISGTGYSLDPVKTSGATTSAEDGRRLLLMVASSMGLPESFFGDVSVGTLATAKSLDRPTELKFRDRQTLWADVLTAIFTFVIEHAKLSGTDSDTGEEIDLHIDIDFPPILHHDVGETVKAIVSAATLEGHPDAGTIPDVRVLSRMLLTALGEDDVDEIIAQLFPEEDEQIRLSMAHKFTTAVEELRTALKDIVEEHDAKAN